MRKKERREDGRDVSLDEIETRLPDLHTSP